MKKYKNTLCFVSLVVNLMILKPVLANEDWLQKKDFPFEGQREPISFSSGFSGYVGFGGFNNRDFYKYDPNDDSWAKVNDLPEGFSFQAPTFALNGNIYIVVENAVWGLNSSTDEWYKRGDIPGESMRASFGFSLNGYGFLGGGFFNKEVFWKYDPGVNVWKQLNPLPNDLANCVDCSAFIISNTAYVTGTNTGFWKYDMGSDQWMQKAYVSSTYGKAFSIREKGYVFNTHGEIYEYDENNDSWTIISTFPGQTICYPSLFLIGESVYIGLGGEFIDNHCTLDAGNEIWEYTPKKSGVVHNEEEPETPVAILSENLDIHIPVLHYQVNDAETQNLEVFLSPAPNQEGVWQLENFSNAVCSSTVNSCSNNFQTPIASSDVVEENIPFDIHIPFITAPDGNSYWANLGFSGVSNGKLLWQLGQFGTTNSVEVKTCNFPYKNFPGMEVNKPSCEQKWNLWNFYKLGSRFLRNDWELQYSKYEGILTVQKNRDRVVKVIQSGLEVISVTQAISEGAAEKTAEALSSLVFNNLTRYIDHDSVALDITLKAQGIIREAALKIVSNAELNPYDVALNAAPDVGNLLFTYYEIFRIDNLVEEMNAINMAYDYLVKYYQYGSDSKKVAEHFTENSNASFEKIFIKIADELRLKNKWYGDDYKDNRVLEIIRDYRDEQIPEITRITLNN